MSDANQGRSVAHAIRLGRRMKSFDLVWFEEPVQAYDLEGSARVAAEFDTPVASGETEYGRYGFRDMLERKAADVLMPDLERVGGVTEWVRVAHMAAAHDVPVSPHLFTEHCLQLCGAISNVGYAEHMPWFDPLFQERVEIADDELLIPDRPGMGFRFCPDAVARYADGYGHVAGRCGYTAAAAVRAWPSPLPTPPATLDCTRPLQRPR